jgi:Zn-dependent protease
MPRSRLVFRTRLAGLPLRVHWTVALAIPVFWYFGQTLWQSLLGLIAWMAILLIHEFGHAFVAQRVGLRVHAINLYPVHGICEYANPRYEMDDVLVAWGGVAGQALLLPLPVLAMASDWLFAAPAPDVLALGLSVLGPINILVIVTNLLPLRGLDGERAWRLFPLLRGQWRATARRVFAKVRPTTKASRAAAQAVATDTIERAKRRAKELG